jgi:hypothetical protein
MASDTFKEVLNLKIKQNEDASVIDSDLISSIERHEEQDLRIQSEIALANVFAKNLQAIARQGKEKFLVYGAGMAGEVAVSAFEEKPYPLDFAGFLDQDTSIQAFCGLPVLNPNDPGVYKGIDAVILCAYASELEMEKKLCSDIFPKLDGVPPVVLKTASSSGYEEYCRRFNECYFLNHDSIHRKAELDGSIVFIAHKPYYNLLRHSVTLQNIGLKTVLATRDMRIINEQGSFFDHVFFFNKVSELEILNNTKILGIHVQNWATKNYFPVSIRKIVNKPAVCEFQDLSCLTLRSDQLYRFAGLTWESFKRDILFEKLVFKHYDAILLPYTRNVIPHLRDRGYTIDSETFFHYSPAPCRRFFSDSDAKPSETLPKLLFVGGIPPDFCDDRLYHDAKLHTIVTALLKDGFQVKILNNPKAARTEAVIRKNYPFYYQLSKREERFSFQIGDPPETLRKKTVGWHFGLMLYDLSQVRIDKAHFDCMVPSKFFTYLELGLPVLVSRSVQAVADLVDKHGLGMVIGEDEMSQIGQVMRGWQQVYPEMIANVKAYREAWDGQRTAATLLSAYQRAGINIPLNAAHEHGAVHALVNPQKRESHRS